MRLPSHLSNARSYPVLAPWLDMMGGRARIVGKRQRRLDWVGPHQGTQEIARRLRQIERGQLTKSNGLVTP